MSGEINNRENRPIIEEKENRKQVLKDIIKELHEGKTIDEVKAKFEETFGEVSAKEITEAEKELILSGTTVAEIQSLCDVHSAVFKGSIKEIHNPSDPSKIPGHPVRTLFLENRALETLMNEVIQVHLDNYLETGSEEEYSKLVAAFEQLSHINLHYMKKETLLFPYMEKYGITAPPKVMWGVDDEIRDEIKQVFNDIRLRKVIKGAVEKVFHRINEMIFKEENIMIPMLVENLTEDEWKIVANDSKDLGYYLIKTPGDWTPEKKYAKEFAEVDEIPTGTISLPTGKFTVDELTKVLNMLPIDITFVDKDDRVKFFSESSERIFPRARSIIGRQVSNCHPPASVHIVEGIVNDFKSGKKDSEDFWIKMGELFIFIRYFALRDDNGDYMGTLEVTQNIGPIQAITGEKRLVSVE